MTATVTVPTGFEPVDPAIREQYDRDGFVGIADAAPEPPFWNWRQGGYGITPTWTCVRCS